VIEIDSLSMGDFVLPDGSLFDTEIGLGNNPRPFKGQNKFRDGTKANLARFGLRPTSVEGISTVSAEVGDDEISVDSTPMFAAAKMTVYTEFLGVKESVEDTSINPRFGNFAEDLVVVPDGYEQTYRYSQQVNQPRNMSFLDVPKLRLAIDIRPGRMNHSSTNDGKAGMLGSRLAWLPYDSPVRCTWEVFNLFQDINLGLIRDDKFAYLPTALGGYGKPIPFGHVPNFEAFCARYKQGTHAGLARELVRRTNRRFTEYTVENRYSIDPVLSAVSRVQSSWHDWIKGKSLYAPTCWLEAPPEVVQHRVAKHGQDTILDSALRRLHAEGYLVSESDLAVAYEHNMLCNMLLGATNHEEFMKTRDETRNSWKQYSTFSMRLYGMLEPLGVDSSLQGPIKHGEYVQFWSFITKSRINLRGFLRQEYFYDKAAKDLIYKNGPMMVNVPIAPKVTQNGRRFWFEQTRDLPDDLETKEEFDLLYEWVKGDTVNTLPKSRRLLDDDPIIIKEITMSNSDCAFCIITDDSRLCRDAYISTRKWIFRVPVKWYYMSLYFGDGSSPWMDIARDKWRMYNWVQIEDTGSIESFEEIGFRDGEMLQWAAERPLRMLSTSFRDGRRIRANRTFPDIQETMWSPYRWPEGYMYTPNDFVKRQKRPNTKGWA
jgi:hypothetical protein